jgi:hypothetical protein
MRVIPCPGEVSQTTLTARRSPTAVTLITYVCACVHYRSQNIIGMIKSSRMRWAEEMRNAQKILVGKPDGKSQLTKSRRRWEGNITWIFKI